MIGKKYRTLACSAPFLPIWRVPFTFDFCCLDRRSYIRRHRGCLFGFFLEFSASTHFFHHSRIIRRAGSHARYDRWQLDRFKDKCSPPEYPPGAHGEQCQSAGTRWFRVRCRNRLGGSSGASEAWPDAERTCYRGAQSSPLVRCSQRCTLHGFRQNISP